MILGVPEYIALADRLNLLTSGTNLQTVQQSLQRGVLDLIFQLDNCVSDLQVHSSSSDTTHFTKLLRSDILGLQKVFSSDPLSGCLAAVRHSAYLICYSLLQSSDNASVFIMDQAIQHSELVLLALRSIENCANPSTSGLYMTTIYALSVVSLWSPVEAHRAYAIERL